MSTRRFLWFGLGVLWIIDGLLQAQPAMFTKAFVTSILDPVAQGQPGWLAGLLAVGTALWQSNMVLANTGALLLQLLIGVLLLTGWRRPWGRLGLGLSILWGLGVWIFGEGLGMLAMGGPTVITGAPGSVLLYVAIAGLLWLPERRWASGDAARWAMRVLGVFWLLGALAQAWPGSGYWTAKGVSGLFQSAAGVPQPAALAAPITAVAAATADAPVLWNGAFVLVMLVLGVALLSGIRARWVWGLSAVWLLFTWWMGQDLGALFSGTSTDPNTAIPLGVLTIALALPGDRVPPWPEPRPQAPRPPSDRAPRNRGRCSMKRSPIREGAPGRRHAGAGRSGRVTRALLASLAACGLALLRPRRAQANGGKVELADQPAGPYRITVTASPNPLRVGSNDLSVLVSAGTDPNQLIADATVTLLAVPAAGGASPTAYPATHANATNKLYYAANVQFPTAGRWAVTVQVAGTQGRGSAQFVDDVNAAVLGMTPFELGCTTVPVLALAAIVAAEVRSRWRRARARARAVERRDEG